MNVILFDGICNLCNGAVTFVVKRDRKGLFRFVSLQSETGKSLLKRYAVESTNKTLYYFRNNRCYSKLPNHEQRYTDHRQIPFSLTSKKYIEIKKE